ncbi:uncharacterized protein LOC116020789 isoform X2 [Ipomoea triloba]|uniref:uncharacterized protein LOC116020789 isoform X2 n=1 Tax=Ipomoea triloba TaxID=35885 RepID=UPI00125D32D5|nr:uncharacterized protein LOC116020789 isoform X2 [Ipomoea triloba]
MDFHSMKRKELQELCKNHGIPANLSNVEMANRLSSIFKGSEKEKPMIRGQSCLKVVGDGENDSDGVNRKAKKVRFSPENELIEFTKSIAKRGCRRKSRMGNSCLIVENACNVELNQRAAKRSPVRVTRSRGLQLLDEGDAEKKVTKRGSNGNGRVEKLCSENEVRVATRRALRNREMQDEDLRESEGVAEGLRKSEWQQNPGSAKGIEDVSESKQIGEEPQGAFRRSKRNAAKKDNGDVGKNENNNGGRLGRKQALLEVEASELEMDGVRCAENGVALVTGDNKEVGVVTRRSLRNRVITVEGKKEREEDTAGLRRSGRQSKQGPLGSDGVHQSQDILEEPKKEQRRSKRNVSNVKDTERNVTLAKDTVMFDENKNSGKVRLGRNQIKLEVKTCKREAAGLKIAEDSFASSNGENRACTKRLLRNKKVAVSEDIDEGLKKMGGQTSIRNEKSGEEGPQNKQIKEELSKGLRRSKRTAAKMDESQYPYQGIGKSKMVRKEQKARSQFAKSVEASMPATEIAALEKNEVGKEPAKATIGSSPQNSMMPLLEKATKETEASSFGAMSETETADESRLEVLIQVEEPTSISPRSSSFNTQFETESAALSRLEVVNQVGERTGGSPRRATVQKSGATFGNVHQNMNQNLSSHLTSNASLEVEVIKDDEMSEADGLKHKTVMLYCNSSIDEQVDSNKTVASRELSNDSSKSFDEHEGTVAEEMRTSRRNASDETGRIHNATVNAAVEKESCNKKSTPAETSSQQLRVDATRDDKIVQPVGEDKDSGSKNMALGVSIAEDLTKINEQCTHVALLSGITDTETTKEPTSTEPLMDESCLEGNESEETRHKKNQVSPNNVGDRIGEVGEVKIPLLVSGVEYSRSDLVDLHTDTEVQIVDIPVTESKGFAEMVKVSMEVNVENSLDDLEVANLAEQEPSEDFNFDIDSASIEANSTIDCYKSNGQLYLTAGVKEMQKKELTEIGYAESVGKEDEIAGENELVVIAEPLNRANEKSPETQVSLVEDRMSNGEKKSLQIGDCTQVAVLSCVEVTDILNEPMNSGSFIDDTIMTSNKFEESAKQSKQRLSPKVDNRKKMEEVNSPQLENAIKESFFELVTSHTDHVEQEKVLVDEIKDISDKVNISLEENAEKPLGGLVDYNVVHCETYEGVNVDREEEMEEVNSPQLENAIKESFAELVTSHTDHVEQEKVLVDEIKDFSDEVNISLEENAEKPLGGLVGYNVVHCETYDGVNVDREEEMEEVNSPQLDNAVKESFAELVTSHTDHLEQEKVLGDEIKDLSDKVNISLEENAEKPLGGLVDYNVVHCETYEGVNVDREEEMEEVNSPQLDNAVKESFAELVTSHTDHVEQEKVLVDEIKDLSDKVNISLEENDEKPLGGLVDYNVVHCETYDGVNVDREEEMEEVNSPQLDNAVKESFAELVTSHTDHVEQEKVLVDEIKDLSDKVNISLEENAEKSLGDLVGHNPVHSITYDGINVDRDTVPFEIISPTKAYGCIDQSDLAADTKEKQTEEVAELQYACSLSKGIGSTIQLVEHAVRGELSGEKKLAVNAADSVNIFATMKVPNDVLQDTLDDRPGENLEDGYQRFEKAGFVDSSEKHKCDASILELHAGNAENIEPASTADWKKALQLGEQSSKLRNSIEFVFVEGDEILKDGDLEDQGIQVDAPDNDGKPSVSDATERRSENSLQEARGSNAEGSVNNVEHEHFPPSESNLQKHGEFANDAGTEIHNQRTYSNGLETGRGLCECEDGYDVMEPEEQLRLLFSTPIKDGSACEENANACYMDSNKTSGQFTDASIAGEELRKLFTTSGDVSCPNGNDKCSDQSTNGLESHRCLSNCECGSDSTEQEYQLRLLFSTPTSIKSTSQNDSTHGLEMDRVLCECIEKFDGLEQDDHLRLLFSTPKSVRGTDEENVKDFYMDKMIEASDAELQKNDLPGSVDSEIEETFKFAEPLGAHGNFPCGTEGSNNCYDNLIATFKVEDSLKASDEVSEEPWISSEAVVLQEGFVHGDISQDSQELNVSAIEKRSGEDGPSENNAEINPCAECPDSGAEFSPSSSLKLNLCLGGNMEEKAQQSQVENICSSSKCNYIKKDDIKGCPTAMVDNDQIIANSYLLFDSPSKLHAITDKRNDLDSNSNECSSTNEDNLGGQSLVVAEMSQPSSCGLVDPQESIASSALHVNESNSSTEENKCWRAKAAEMELYTSQPCLKPTHQSTAEIDSDGDKDASLSLEKNGSREEQNANSSLLRKSDTRRILIHATPYKKPMRVDMKENAPAPKGGLIGTLTAARPENRRRPLKDLQWNDGKN